MKKSIPPTVNRAKIGSRGTAGTTAPSTGPSLGISGVSKPVATGNKK